MEPCSRCWLPELSGECEVYDPEVGTFFFAMDYIGCDFIPFCVLVSFNTSELYSELMRGESSSEI
jgi:hypothetical protein